MIRGIVSGSRDPPIAKVMPSRQQTTANIIEGQLGQQSSQNATSVFIHTTPPNVSQAAPTVSSVSSTALPSNTFISHPTKFIFDHMPTTSSVNVSSASFIDSMFSVTKTSVSKSGGPTSTIVTPMITSQAGATEAANTVISSTVSYTPSASSFAVVPSANRGVGQIHVSTSSINQANQIQAVPVRFNPQLIVDSNQPHSGTQIIAMSNSNQLASIQSSSGGVLQSTPSSIVCSTNSMQQQQQQQQIVQPPQPTPQTHIMIPASVTKVESPRPGVVAAANATSVLRKRDVTGSPVAKNLAAAVSAAAQQLQKMEVERPVSPPSRPPSTDGSTTVSATSSPNLDQQEQEERASMEFGSRLNDYFNAAPTTSARGGQLGPLGVPHQNSTGSSSNGLDPTPRKKPKRSL